MDTRALEVVWSVCYLTFNVVQQHRLGVALLSARASLSDAVAPVPIERRLTTKQKKKKKKTLTSRAVLPKFPKQGATAYSASLAMQNDIIAGSRGDKQWTY